MALALDLIQDQQGHIVKCVYRDIEKWGEVTISLSELIKSAFEFIADSDLTLIEFSEKGVG